MTLRTITFDDSIYKLVPLEPTDEMRFQTTHVHNDIEDEDILEMLRVAIASAPEYQDTCTDGGKCGAGGYCKDCIQDTKKDE